MKNFITALKKYIWVIMILILVSVNSLSIKRNTDAINLNVNTFVSNSHCIGCLADVLTNVMKRYEKDKVNYKETGALTEVCLDQTVKNKVAIKDLGEHSLSYDLLLNEKINALHQKPSYEYLKSVTVFIIGKTVNRLPKDEANPNGSIVLSWCGTGVIVKQNANNTYILTNKHVAGGFLEVPIKIEILHNNKKVVCELIKYHKSQDLALLKIKGNLKNKSVVKGLAFPEITEKVYTVGHSLGRPFIYGEGVFSGTIIEHDIYQLPCVFGQSGSGVFNSNGELLGLVYSVAISQGGHDFTRANVVKGVYILEFLKENLK